MCVFQTPKYDQIHHFFFALLHIDCYELDRKKHILVECEDQNCAAGQWKRTLFWRKAFVLSWKKNGQQPNGIHYSWPITDFLFFIFYTPLSSISLKQFHRYTQYSYVNKINGLTVFFLFRVIGMWNLLFIELKMDHQTQTESLSCMNVLALVLFDFFFKVLNQLYFVQYLSFSMYFLAEFCVLCCSVWIVKSEI